MSFKVIGVIRESKSNNGIPGLMVKAFDKDAIFDDLLGFTMTGEGGSFEINYEEQDFKQLFEGNPDIYITVNTKDRRVIYTTEKNVRIESGKIEQFDIRIPMDVVEGKNPLSVGLRFSRRMSGFFLENTDDFQHGAKVGEKRKNIIEIKCRITVDELDKFLKDSDHVAQLDGQIDYGDLGNGLRIQNGIFNLFKPDSVESKRKVIYQFNFNSKSGQPYLFVGENLIYRDRSSTEVLTDISTLYTRIYHGYSNSGKISGAGILGFRATAFPDIFNSLEILNASNSLERIGAISTFYGFIYKELENIYMRD